jgi:hypothetical protein
MNSIIIIITQTQPIVMKRRVITAIITYYICPISHTTIALDMTSSLAFAYYYVDYAAAIVSIAKRNVRKTCDPISH